MDYGIPSSGSKDRQQQKAFSESSAKSIQIPDVTEARELVDCDVIKSDHPSVCSENRYLLQYWVFPTI
jgi:hypothetical protein